MLDIVLTAIALVLVFEGFMPFLSPGHWRQMMLKLARSNDKSLRLMGLLSMSIGAVLMLLIHVGIL